MILTAFTIILYSGLLNKQSASAYRFCILAKWEGTFKKGSSLRDCLSFLSFEELITKPCLGDNTHSYNKKKTGWRSHNIIII